MTSVTIRIPQQTDSDFLAWAILTASRSHLARGWFDVALGMPEQRCVEFIKRLCVTKATSWWHYSRFLLAEHEGKAVGALSAFRAGEAYPLSQLAMSEAADALEIPTSEQSAIWERGSYIFLCTLGGADDCWTLENIATLPAYRRRGIAAALLARAIEEGRARGLREAQISYLIGNEAAEHAYDRAGFHFVDERRDPRFAAAAGSPGMRRVVRPL